MAVKIGTTIAGTYKDGPGNVNQNHLMYAANCSTWWLFTINSATDVAGNPGTHTLDAYYSSNLTTWTKSTSSPNLDASSGTGNLAALFGGVSTNGFHGRALGCLYVNNSAGSNKDLAYLYASVFGDFTGAGATDSWNGLIRAVLGPTSITWGNWGGWSTGAFNLIGGSTQICANNVLGITTDGFLQMAGCVLHSELDASVCTTIDNAVSDTYSEGCITASGTTANASALVTALSNQLRLKVGMSISQDAADWNVNRYPKINSIDSSTQVTASSTSTGAGAGQNIRWWQGTCGSTRINSTIDGTMTHECGTHALSPLASGGMIVIYGDGANIDGGFNDLRSIKANQTQGQGFWPSTTDGTGLTTVFGASVATNPQDWCVINVSTSQIYAARRTGTTSIAVSAYNTGTNTWAATTNQPGATPGSMAVGDGLAGVSNGTDFWLFALDDTHSTLIYNKYTVLTGTWAGWVTADNVDATATNLSGCSTAGSNRAALTYSVTNGGSFDTYVSTLFPLVPDPPPAAMKSYQRESIQQRMFL